VPPDENGSSYPGTNWAILVAVGQPRSDDERIARNEALFRQVNERVRDVSQAFATLDPTPIDFVCECGMQDCTEPVRLQLAEYEAVRASPTAFFVLPNHVIAEVERVVSDRGDYVVVQKLPHANDIARETDPRS
jgi:hypothetical protein